MSLYLVNDGDRRLWVAHESEAGQLYVYVPNTGRFHRNRGLAHDFYGDQRYTYQPLSSGAEVQDLIRTKVGKLDGRTKRAQLDRYKADTAALDPDDVLGELEVLPSPRQRSAAKLTVLAHLRRGEWGDWKTYPAADRQLAHVAVNDVRRGKYKTVATMLGNVDARVVTGADGRAVVQLARASDESEKGRAAS